MTIMGSIIEFSLEDVKSGIADGTLLLVDVREPHEFASGHIPGSVTLPLSSFDPADIPDGQGRNVVFSCAAGVRSLRAIEAAHSAGLDYSAHYPGGFKDWVMSGQEVDVG